MVDYTLKCTSEKFQNDTHAYCMGHASKTLFFEYFFTKHSDDVIITYYCHIENLKRNDLNLPNTVTKNWNQNNAEMRILAYVAKESFHDSCFYLYES